MTPLVVVDADVLGRERTGDETYVLNLLRELAPLAPDAGLRIAAVTRDPDARPRGNRGRRLGTSFQELRMAVTLPRLLRRLGAALGHFQYALPLALPCPAVVTIHDLSFEREPSLMSRKDRFVFRKVVPRAARKAVRVLTVSERTRRDLRELYDVPDEKIVVTPNGVDPAFTPGNSRLQATTSSLVGAVQERKNPLAALAAADAAGLPLVVAGPAKDEALARELERRGARVTGYVEQDELVAPLPRRRLPRAAVALRGLRPARARGDGLRDAGRRRAGAGAAGGRRRRRRLGRGARARGRDPARGRRARARSSRPGSSGRALFSWRETARRTLEVYREALGR